MMSECQNCRELWSSQELNSIDDLMDRVAPGEPMPSGECSGCGGLCQPLLSPADAAKIDEMEKRANGPQEPYCNQLADDVLWLVEIVKKL